MAREARPTSKRRLYAVIGAALSVGAPAGLVVVHLLQRGTREGAAQLLAREAWTYAYVAVSTLVAFTAFGYALGRQADRLLELAGTDALTGLGNRHAFRERLAEEHARFSRYGQPLSLLLLDLDGLKSINDRLGHTAGDAALVRLAAAIRAEARAADACARWGGDEFAVLAPSTAEDAAAVLAERIRARLAADWRGEGRLTVSIGMATAAPAGPEAADRVRAADRALYQAKALGGNQVYRGSPAPAQARWAAGGSS